MADPAPPSYEITSRESASETARASRDGELGSPSVENYGVSRAALFPAFLKLTGRHCLMVGAGRIAESKVNGLVQAGSTVRVVAPEATNTIARWAEDRIVLWEQREFRASDLDGIFLAVVATSRRELNERVYAEAQSRRVLCNVVDDPLHCDFYYPAVVRRGDLQIAISTNGQSPALAQRLRREFEQQFGPEYEHWLNELGLARKELFAQPLKPDFRRELLHQLASREKFEAFMRYQGSASGPGERPVPVLERSNK